VFLALHDRGALPQSADAQRGKSKVAKGCFVSNNAPAIQPEARMAVALKLSDALVEDAKVVGAAEHRSVPKQIEYWARIGKAVLENPDLPLQVIQDTMLSLEEAKAGQLAPYSFG
jgi:hypothetical protein